MLQDNLWLMPRSMRGLPFTTIHPPAQLCDRKYKQEAPARAIQPALDCARAAGRCACASRDFARLTLSFIWLRTADSRASELRSYDTGLEQSNLRDCTNLSCCF
jgi:hypothetical protein